MRSFSPIVPPPAAALPLKDSLRTVRFALRRGRKLLPPPPVPLPHLVRSTASTLLADFDTIAVRVNSVLAGLSHSILDAEGRASSWKAVRLEDLLQAERPDALFAEVAYRALNRILHDLGAEEALVSETRAASAWQAAAGAGAGRIGTAAALAEALIRRRVVQDVVQPSEATASAEIAAFALALWLVSERPDDDEDADDLLAASAELASALAGDVDAARADPAALAALIATYADKL